MMKTKRMKQKKTLSYRMLEDDDDDEKTIESKYNIDRTLHYY